MNLTGRKIGGISDDWKRRGLTYRHRFLADFFESFHLENSDLRVEEAVCHFVDWIHPMKYCQTHNYNNIMQGLFISWHKTTVLHKNMYNHNDN